MSSGEFPSVVAVLGQLHAVPPLLFVDVDNAQRPGFEALLGSLHRYEEVHLLLTASHYRERLLLIAQLRRYSCPFVCLTATLQFGSGGELKGLLNFTMPNVSDPAGRIICFVRRKALGEELVDHLVAIFTMRTCPIAIPS